MQKYIEKCKYNHTKKIIEKLYNHNLIEDVHHVTRVYLNQNIDCIKINTKIFDATIPISNKEIYVISYIYPNKISVAQRIFPYEFSGNQISRLILDIVAIKEENDDFTINFINDKMFVISYYEDLDDVSDLFCYMKDIELKSHIAIKRIESLVYKKVSEEMPEDK